MGRPKKTKSNKKLVEKQTVGKSKYNPEYHDRWAWSLSLKGATAEDIAAAFGMSSRTIERWINLYPTFRESVHNAREKANGEIEKSMFERAKGFYVTETKTVTGLIDKNGMPLPPRVEQTKKYIAGDVGAMIFWLKNRDRENWKDKPIADTLKIESEKELVKIYLPELDENKSDNVCQQQQSEKKKQTDRMN